ncbi:MAG: conjugal transfer protein TraL [Pseudomonadota bacterium]
MANVHFFLQGKGGVGKSFCSNMCTQYLSSKNVVPICFDTDPVNATFASFKSIGAKWVDIRKTGGDIDPIKFDIIMERIAALQDNEAIIVDNGASSFIPCADYLISNAIPDMVQDMGHALFAHVIIIGGDGMMDTLNGFSALAQQLPPAAKLIVWLNPHFGEIIGPDGKAFEEFKLYKNVEERIHSLIKLPSLQRDTFGVNITDMQKKRLTFDEAIARPDCGIMDKQRLTIARKKIFEAISLSEV